MDRFLVIGATGFIGRHCVRQLAMEHEVLGTTTRPSAENLVPFDLTRDSIAARLPAAWKTPGPRRSAILCAAVSPIDRCAEDRELAEAVMLDGTRRCAAELAELGYRLVFLSSSYVFADEARGYREDDLAKPLNVYGHLKRAIEQHLEAAHPNSLILRLGKVVSDSLSDEQLLSDWHRRAVQGGPLTCIAGQMLQPTLVDDVVETLRRACSGGLRGYYHVANPEVVRREELAARWLAACGLQAAVQTVSLEQLQLAERRPIHAWLNVEKIKRDLDVRFASVDDILERFRDKLV